MCDASCPKCGKRFGWAGGPLRCPPCPRCGHEIDRAALEHDQAEIDRARESMLADGPETASGRTEAVFLQDWPPGTYVYVGRANPRNPETADGTFGNPFSNSPKSRALVTVASVALAVECYRRWLEGDPEIFAMLPATYESRRQAILAALPSLRGKRLGCWRHEPPCHAQCLAELADGPLGDPKPMEAS